MEKDEDRKASKKSKRPSKISKVRYEEPEQEENDDNDLEPSESYEETKASPKQLKKPIAVSLPARTRNSRNFHSEEFQQQRQEVPNNLFAAREQLEQLANDYEQVQTTEGFPFVPRPPPLPKPSNIHMKAKIPQQQYQTKGPSFQTKIPVQMSNQYQYQQNSTLPPFLPEPYASNFPFAQENYSSEPLPPITTVENVTDIFQTTLQTSSVTKFKVSLLLTKITR